MYKTQGFNIHIYKEPIENLCIVHAQPLIVGDIDGCDNGESHGNQNHEGNEPTMDFPPFLDLDRRLKDNKEDNEKYGAFSMSRINK